MEKITFMASSLVTPKPQQPNQRIELTPWDLQLLTVGLIQKGLLFHKPIRSPDLLPHLKSSLSTTLRFFPPLAGRLASDQHDDEDSTTTFYIDCNNAGALFVHAVADGVTVADIAQTGLVPSAVVHQLFRLNGAKNYEGTRDPLLAVQVTELADGVFIGCSLNHAVADGSTFWNFFNSWSEISRGLPQISKSPSFSRWSPDGSDLPIRISSSIVNQFPEEFVPLPVQESYFHFGRDKIAELKNRANSEAGTTKISSLQAVLTQLWRSIIKLRKLDPEEETAINVAIGARSRLPLPENYFGNAFELTGVRMRVNELLAEKGIGNAALEMNKMIRDCADEERMSESFRCWPEKPSFFKIGKLLGRRVVATSSSPRFDVYENDFGWGKPVAVRSGAANKAYGKLTLFCGREEGSIDVEVCLESETLDALTTDQDFLEFAA